MRNFRLRPTLTPVSLLRALRHAAAWTPLAHGALLFTLGACSTVSSRVQAQYATERRCDQDKVRVEHRGNVVVATGCGAPAEYICGTNCVERGVRSQASPGPDAPPSRYPQERGMDQPQIPD